METLTQIPNIPLFFTFFLIIYLIAYFIIFKNWSQKLKPEASSCAISFIHGTPAVFLAFKAIFADPNFHFHSQNTPFHDFVLDYSISYFLMDLLHYLIFYPSDVLFIGHHLAVLFVFLTCRFVVFHGGCALLVLLILAEVTSFCQNTWTLASSRRSDSAFAAKVYDFLSPPFYALYTLVRGFAGPAFVYKMFVFYVSGGGDGVVPKWAWISWIFVVFMAISVSILWIVNRWIDYFRERSRKMQNKVK
ncbi:hypothetical protein LIER_11125 [Lithospermum erythrorhizon]|uniref:TLC domain-containing protein n=1 Tax=Lithospermum erythrorhizon TaxID=34254 RepID=A0AAV3PNM4_LITER